MDFLKKLLFETRIGQVVLSILERRADIAIIEGESGKLVAVRESVLVSQAETTALARAIRAK